MNNSPEKRAELEQRIEELKQEDREVWYNYDSEYKIVEDYLYGMYIKYVPQSERLH